MSNYQGKMNNWRPFSGLSFPDMEAHCLDIPPALTLHPDLPCLHMQKWYSFVFTKKFKIEQDFAAAEAWAMAGHWFGQGKPKLILDL